MKWIKGDPDTMNQYLDVEGEVRAILRDTGNTVNSLVHFYELSVIDYKGEVSQKRLFTNEASAKKVAEQYGNGYDEEDYY